MTPSRSPVRALLTCGLLLIWASAFAAPAAANSLWAGGNLYSDSKARQVGDLVTIVISERSEAVQQASTSMGKEADLNVGPGVGALADLIPLLRVGGSDSSQASGSTSRGGELRAQMTARIVEILPNGHFAIEGRQQIVINDEEQEIVVSGVIRPSDIRRDNTVLSPYLADARIEFHGQGLMAEKQTPGLITRLFGWFF